MLSEIHNGQTSRYSWVTLVQALGFSNAQTWLKYIQQASAKGLARSTREPKPQSAIFVTDHAQSPFGCQQPDGRDWGLPDSSKHGNGHRVGIKEYLLIGGLTGPRWAKSPIPEG